MQSTLKPIGVGLDDCLSGKVKKKWSYAQIDRDKLLSLVRTMPDCQSAVLTTLVWQASRQERFAQGEYAGHFVARLSGKQLADMTCRPLRTIRHALQRLTAVGAIKRFNAAPGKTAVYALSLRTAD